MEISIDQNTTFTTAVGSPFRAQHTKCNAYVNNLDGCMRAHSFLMAFPL